MRNLKRVLSLALALVMVLGMMVITTSAADYTDAEEITYTEAVEVMSTIGILKGNPNADGTFTFDPQGTLTRAQAAKIIAFVCLGAEADEYLTGSTAAFEDVKADSWAAKYVAFCKNAKIIDGVNAEKTLFNPTGTLNTVQFAKMLLGALGIEGTFTGEGWEANVKTAAAEAGLDVIDIDRTDITREEACEMALAAMRDYSATAEVYWTLTVAPVAPATEPTVYEFATQKDALLYKALLQTGTVDGPFVDYADTLLWDVYGVTYNDDTTDAYGRPAVSYTGYNNSFKLVYTADPVMTSTGVIKAAELYNKLGFKAVLAASESAYTYGAGHGTAAFWTDSTAMNTDYAVADKNVNIGRAGVLTEIYKVDSRLTPNQVEYAVVQVKAQLAKVGTPAKTDATATDGAFTTYTLDIEAAGIPDVSLIDFTTVVNAATNKDNYNSEVALAKDDYVWVYSNANGTYTVAPAETKTVTATWCDATSFVADGVTYKYNAEKFGAIAAADVTNKAAKVVYLDLYGNVAKVANPTGALPNYAMVLDYGSETVMASSTTYYAELLYTDGTTETVKVSANARDFLGDMVTYAEGTGPNTGKIVLADASDWTGTIKLEKNKAVQAGDTYNDKTVFVIHTTPNGKDVYTAYTGITNIPTVTGQVNVKIVDGVVKVCFVMNGVLESSDAAAKNVVYVNAGSEATATDVNKGSYYTYNAIVNGEITKIESAVQIASDVYGGTLTNNKGLVSGTIALSGVGIGDVTATGTKVAKDGVIQLGAGKYIYDESTVVYEVAMGSNVISASSIASIVEDNTDNVYGYTTNGILTMIVIEKVAG